MVILDSCMLAYMLKPDALPPVDESTGARVPHTRERIEHLIKTLEQDNRKILVPTPVLAELLVIDRKKADELLIAISSRRVFRNISFDQRAAVELALNLEDEHTSRRLTVGPHTKAKLRFDRQIIAIARAQNVEVIYSDDRQVKKLGRRLGLTVLGVSDLELPPATHDLFDSL
ncbi:PIN domain-containing protein [Marinobacterium mangrovicola]|uniref:PIN domain-containing protein n=1 Tax=Marinobacterium mangrovicola TaxID=1476959 RepID=A0A4R1GG33_9GAMM|nr:PIN domain-containing protein [Marinobacterium mangrovicola]TCK05871.1 PIN domain-containing protein [Marinobacterium mangrovicola]